MPYKENLKRATELKAELDSYRPLSVGIESRIMQKFRLDWNYHSAHIEGNQLTYGETKALLLFGHTANAKPLKDHLEMTGHNEAIRYIEEVIRQDRPLSEAFIREIHALILKEPYEVDAITPDGKPTRRTIAIGQYKTVPNHVRTKTGEMFYFATPEETPAEMDDLMAWYRKSLDDENRHPVLFATEFHYRFICIHPFDDGNGRMARLLMNFILLMKGYPPAIIRTEEKDNYFTALQQADAGQIDYFFNYVCEQEIHSLQLMIKAAKGEEIEEPEDLDKKLALLEKELEAVDPKDEVKYHLSQEVFINIFHSWLGDLIKAAVPAVQKFNKFFTGTTHSIHLAQVAHVQFIDETPAELLKKLDQQLKENARPLSEHALKAGIYTQYGTLIKGGLKTFGCNYSIEIKFETIKYEVYVDLFEEEKAQATPLRLFEGLLHQPLSEAEIKKVVKQLTDTIYSHIDYHTKKNGLR